ncbi:prephenate dehydratase [Dokdonia sp. 4H-3-7-5]|uniref:prephenate dehydratase n=1 Tax=Dokdonia sp. (strain 4H-3-7-5) TaxID=983548 RepID=UPI00020A69D7|nr:prephenate dehydratase [Dokdonia sp. 4H-3-7-5]AEE18492.1 Prephenate dehydratase [Dokdonia sp. 4H-3-7-5]
MKVAIQGVQGSFHHKVAQEFFGTDVAVVECMSFPRLVDALVEGEVQDAVMAIENSIAGSILPNYALLDKHDLHIEGEFYLDIQHQLMALPGQGIEDIKEVWSHPMAILQCREFFRNYPDIKLVEDTDTAGVAREIQEKQLQGIGAIASTVAASIYKLNILQASIQTINENATRFFILNKDKKQVEGVIDKASLRFSADHKRGSLAAILNVLSDCKMNLTKIQSMPIIEKPWKYAFFVDVTFEKIESFNKAVQLLEIMANDFKVLGAYKNRKHDATSK